MKVMIVRVANGEESSVRGNQVLKDGTSEVIVQVGFCEIMMVVSNLTKGIKCKSLANFL